jgi:outer membrane receptor protein involved in Fe transport
MTWVSRLSLTVLLYTQAASLAGAAASGSALQVAVTDSGNLPIPGARVEVMLAGHRIASAVTGESGQAAFPDLAPAPYEITAAKDGFEPGRLTIADAAQPIHLTLEPAAQHESVKVMSAAAPIDQGSSAPVELTPQQVKELPSRPATVSDALPMVPGVIRKPDGGIEISGSPEHRSSLIVNSADVTDPATGQFGLTVPIDSVQSVTVYQTPFLAEYGRFTAGLVSVETRRGGDEWKWEINDPFPDFAIRSYHLRGLRDATPR